MERLPEMTYLQMPSDTLEVVRKDINMEKPGEMKEAVRILDEWVKRQPHFAQKELPSHYLEMSIVTSKGSVERAKRTILNMCTARSLKPENFEARDPREYYEIFKPCYSVIATPVLTTEYYRIVIVKSVGKCGDEILEAVYKYAYFCVDYLKVHDYHSGVVAILDATEFDVQHFVTHINFLELRNNFMLFLESYGMRLKKCHVVSSSKAVHVGISLLSPFFSKKIVERVVVHEKVEELLQYYPKDSLPKEFGGTGQTLSVLQEKLTQEISSDEHMQHMKLMSEFKIEKSQLNLLTSVDGINGTFRSLNID